MLITSAGVGVTPTHALVHSRVQTLRGTVESGGIGLRGFEVSLYAGYSGGLQVWRVSGTATSDDDGNFTIRYRSPIWLPAWLQPLLFVVAEEGPAMLATAIGRGPAVDGRVAVNELTTVATGFAFAQFIDGRRIRGNRYGMINAVQMAANLASRRTGEIGDVLGSSPNGSTTSTLPKFNSLSNIVAGCVANDGNCAALIDATTPTGGSAPTTVLQAVANIANL